MNEENGPLDEKLNQAIKIFGGINETLSDLLRPPIGLSPEKRGMLVCLAVGTLGFMGLVHMNAQTSGLIAYAALVGLIAILVGYKKMR
jgi:hypothetical protein